MLKLDCTHLLQNIAPRNKNSTLWTPQDSSSPQGRFPCSKFGPWTPCSDPAQQARTGEGHISFVVSAGGGRSMK